MAEPFSLYCPYYQRAVELIGGRWTGAIIRALLGGVTRFSDLNAAIPGLSDRMLANRLRELEAEGILTRVVVPEMPVRVEYRLTDKGRGLSQVIAAIVGWLGEWTDYPAQPFNPEPAVSGSGLHDRASASRARQAAGRSRKSGLVVASVDQPAGHGRSRRRRA